MTADLLEPFNDFTTNGWTGLSDATIVAGRTGTAAQLNNIFANASWNLAAPIRSDHVVVGCAFRHNGSNGGHVFQLRGDAGATVHTNVGFGGNGVISARRGPTVLAQTPAPVLAADTWGYVEGEFFLHDTAGYVVVRLNGVEIINTGPVDTRNAGTVAVYDQLRIGSEVPGNICLYDDLYLWAGPDATFLGDFTIPPGPITSTAVTGIAVGTVTLGGATVGVPPPHPAWPSTTWGPIIEIGYPYDHGPEFLYDFALYDTDGRYGPWWQWVRVDCEAQSATIVRGASSPAERIASGTATVTLTDPDGLFAPWRQNAAGARPNRANLPLRISITDGETVWPLYFGWVDVWNDVDAWDEPGTVTLTASDGMKHLALLDQGATSSQGAGEAAGARISRILDRAGWQNRAPRHLSTGTIALQATTLVGPALDEIQLVADTEAGAVWIDTEGTFRFVDRNWLRTAAKATPWLIGDASLLEPGAACASAIVSVADDMAIQNVIGVAKVGGTQSWVEDATSIAKYGRHTWSRTDLPYLNDEDTATILAVQLADRADRDYFLQAVVLSPLTEESAWPIVASVELFDTVLVTRSRGGTVLQEYASVIGIDHTLGPAEMVTVLSLGPRLRVELAHYDVDLYDEAVYSGV